VEGAGHEMQQVAEAFSALLLQTWARHSDAGTPAVVRP